MVHKDLDAVYVPELAIDIEAEAARLRKAMDKMTASPSSCPKARASMTSWPRCAPAAKSPSAMPSAM